MELDQKGIVKLSDDLALCRVKNSGHYVLVALRSESNLALIEWASADGVMKWMLKLFNALTVIKNRPEEEKTLILSPALVETLNSLLEELDDPAASV